jgi:hypothetical protein
MKTESELKRAKGPKTAAVSVNQRVHVTYKLRKTWVGLTIDFKAGSIQQTRLKSLAEARDFLKPGQGHQGYVKLGTEKWEEELAV